MKVLFYVNYPFAWAPGGHSSQIINTQRAMEDIGLETQWLKHEITSPQEADIIHYWGLPPSDAHWRLAKNIGLKIVISTMNQGAGRRGPIAQKARGITRSLVKHIMGDGIYGMAGYEIYKNADACICLTTAEAKYLTNVFGTDPKKISVIPNGVDEAFLQKPPDTKKQEYLLMPATIRALKNQLAVAKAAISSQTPVRFIGRPMIGEETYFARFKDSLDGNYAQYFDYVDNVTSMRDMICQSCGVFLASNYEAQPLVLLEALACGIPVMAPDLLTIHSYFGNAIEYCSPPSDASFPDELKEFHKKCMDGLTQEFLVHSWSDIANQVSDAYQKILTK